MKRGEQNAISVHTTAATTTATGGKDDGIQSEAFVAESISVGAA